MTNPMCRSLICWLTLLSWVSLIAQSDYTSVDLSGIEEIQIIARLSNVEVIATEGDQLEFLHRFKVNETDRSAECVLDQSRTGRKLILRETYLTAEIFEGNWSMGDRYINSGNSHWDEHDNYQQVSAGLVIRVPAGIKVSIQSEYGNFKTENLMELGSVEVTYGRISLAYAQTLPEQGLQLEATYGSIRLQLPAELNAHLDLQNQYGSFRSAYPMMIPANGNNRAAGEGHLKAIIGSGGPPLNLRAPYSSVRLSSY